MKRSLNELIGYEIQGKDYTKGNVKDFLFDEDEWVIKYLDADLVLLSGRKILIPKIFLKEPDWSNHQFPIELSKTDVEKCPELAENLPVSKKYEHELNKHYKTNDYWPYSHVSPVGAPGVTYPPRPVKIPSKMIDEKELDTSLRSFSEIKGYYIKTLDGKIGHIDDIIIDDTDWQIVYAVVDTSNWLPWSKKVLISPHSMDEISYLDQEIEINLTTETIESAPAFDSSKPMNEEYEKELHDHFGRFTK
jgi:sporulation protein YlmC with PRC-barrel domain